MSPRVLLVALLIALAPAPSSAQQLPDDSDAYYLVTLTQDPPTPACASLLRSLESPDLAPILRAVKRFAFTPTSPLYRTRYADSLPVSDLPTLALIRYDGGVLYKSTGSAIPTGARLAAELTRVATADRAIQSATRPRIFPDNATRPRLIPDTVTIQPQVTIPPVVILIGAIVLLLLGLAFLAIVGVAVYLALRFLR